MRTTAIGYRENLPVTDPACLVAHEADVSAPGPHDLLVEVEAVSVNPVDTKQRRGVDPQGLRVLGFDAAGRVRAVGEDVTLFAPGEHVFYAGQLDRPGSDQRLQLVDERIVGHAPASVAAGEAASLPLVALTAWESLFDRLRLEPSATGTLLVVGGTGGVGTLVVQLARALLPGVRIIATASGAERARWVRELGAHHAVDHHGDLAAQVLALAGDGVDWVFTSHSAGQAEVYARIVRPFGQIVAIDEGPGDLAALKPRSLSWHWEFMFTRPVQRTPDMVRQHEILERVAQLVDAGRVRPVVTRTFSPITPETLREAHALIEGGHTLGKIVLHGWE